MKLQQPSSTERAHHTFKSNLIACRAAGAAQVCLVTAALDARKMIKSGLRAFGKAAAPRLLRNHILHSTGEYKLRAAARAAAEQLQVATRTAHVHPCHRWRSRPATWWCQARSPRKRSARRGWRAAGACTAASAPSTASPGVCAHVFV